MAVMPIRSPPQARCHLAVHRPVAAEERRRPFERLVDELIDDHQVARRDLVPQRPDRPAGDHRAGAELLEREDIGRIRDLAR